MESSSFFSKALSQTHVLAVIGAGLLFALTAVEARAQRDAQVNPITVMGTIQSFSTAPNGEVNGCVLNNGNAIHWPSNLGQNVTGIAAIGDRIRVVGWRDLIAPASTRIQAQQITNLQTNVSVNLTATPPLPAPPPGPVPARPRVSGDPLQPNPQAVRGIVQKMTVASNGDVNGCVLSDGTVVRWPQQLADRFTRIIQKGDHMQATGQMETGSDGVTFFDVRNVTNLDSRVYGGVDSSFIPLTPEQRATRDVRVRELEDQVDGLKKELQQLREEKK
jgi:hypothetical protein